MEQEQLDKEIRDRIEIERRVREQLNSTEEEPEPRRWEWLNSKVSLLVVGALLSGILIPMFQFTQEQIRWRRQNQYDSIEQQLGSVRESLKQFIAVQGLSGELFDLGLEMINTDSSEVNRNRIEDWDENLRELRARRIKQNATFSATVFYYPTDSREPIRDSWNGMILPVERLDALASDILRMQRKILSGEIDSLTSKNRLAVEFDARRVEVNRTYEHVLTLLRLQLREVEYEKKENF